MKLVHNVKLSVFVHEEDGSPLNSLESVESALVSFLPFDLVEKKVELKKEIVEGFDHNKIHIFKVELTKDGLINKFLDALLEKLKDDQKELLVSQAESRLDEELHFFIRFDKRKLLDEQRLWITDKGDCFHIKMTIAAYPAKREKGLEVVKQLFEPSHSISQ